MTRLHWILALGLGYAAVSVQPLMAQEDTLQAALSELNRSLQAYAYQSPSGGWVVSRLALTPDGRLSVETTRSSETGSTTTVFRVYARQLDLTAVQIFHQGNHSVLHVGCQPPAEVWLRCVLNGRTQEWPQPALGYVSVAFEQSDAAEAEIKDSVVRLITLARQE